MSSQWLRLLQGAWLSAARKSDGDGNGVLMAFKPAIATRRFLFVSDAFRMEEPKLADVVVHAAKLPRNKWKVLGSLA